MCDLRARSARKRIEGEGGGPPPGRGSRQGKVPATSRRQRQRRHREDLKSKFSRAAAAVCGRRASLTNGNSELCPRGVLIGMKVAVIGAGVAGLQQGRAFQKCGIDFHIYETEIGVGGVWRTTAHLQGAQGKYMHMPNSSTSCNVRQYRHSANTPTSLLPSSIVSSMQCKLECRTHSHALLAVTYPYYEFPEFPWPDALIQKHRGTVTPPAPAVQQYIEVLLGAGATPVTVLKSSKPFSLFVTADVHQAVSIGVQHQFLNFCHKAVADSRYSVQIMQQSCNMYAAMQQHLTLLM